MGAPGGVGGRFAGFPSQPRYVPIPSVFFSDLLPQITDAAELQVTLHLFRLLAAVRGYPQAVARHQLTDDPSLAAGLTALGRTAQAEAERGLEAALARGAFLQAEGPNGPLLLINNPAGQKAAAAIAGGESGTGRSAPAAAVPARAVAPADIFTLYEENIGMLTPIIAEQLAEAEREYPAGWITEAVTIAVEANQRHWRYVGAILQRWKAEGKDHGKPARHPAGARRPADYTDWLPSRPTQR